jgi:signal transduction histidine kinase/putative methionine-R-sulfoxide reductase with GAF domain
MSGAEHIFVISMGRPSDIMLEDTIAAEGFIVTHIPTLQEGLAKHGLKACSAVVFLAGRPESGQVEALLREATEQLPAAKFLVAMDNGATKAISSDLEQALAGRLLRLEGEIALSKNIEKVRRFLRGEGYSWASDLGGAADRDDSLLAATGSLPEGRQDKLRSIHRFASDLSRYTELQPMLQEALRRYLDILQCDAGSIYLWDENTETLILEAAHGADERERVGLRQKLGEGLAGWVAEVGQPILVTDSRKVHKLQGRVSSRYSNFSCIAAPITHGGQLFGIVCLTMPKDNQPFDPEDLRLAQALSQKLASAIRPLSVLSELRRFSERLLGAFKSSSDSEIKKDAQVESLRVLSGNILESVPMAIIAYDRELRVRSSNRVARSLFTIETPAASEPGPAPLEQGVELDKTLWRNRLLSVIEAGRKFRLQRVGYRARPTDGGQAGDRKLVLDIHCSPLTDPEGQTVGGILTVQDVTEDLEMEAKLSSAERLALVGKLAAKVAHELNNPLDGILRFLNLAMRQLDKPEQARAYLEDSRIGLLRMSNILKELLVFSRSHREPATVTSLSQVIQQALAPYEHRARECRTQIRLDVPPNLPPCPSNELWEVIGNVVKNALDAMGENGTLTIRAVQDDRRVTIIISDTGPGVPEELREKIFEPFFTTKQDRHGTGLGLALCRDALRRIGGEITLVPSERGAAFQLVCPIKSLSES